MKKILFIEDDPVVLKVLQSRLAKEGAEITVAIDPDEGLQKAKTEHPDLIMLDVILKEKSGLDVLADIRIDQPWGAHVPAIILTTDDSKETREKATALGVQDYFVKGVISLQEIVARIKEILAL